MAYASNTSVDESRSRAELEKMLARFGADEFGYYTTRDSAIVLFVYNKTRCKLSVPLPDRDADEFTKTPAGRKRRTADAAVAAWQQETRRRWRSLCMVVKALLVGVQDGVLSFEQAFMPYILMGDERTVFEHLNERLQTAIESGQMPMDLKALEVLP